ncbi:hypothetical protein TWF481_007077 [Arthrobotrys musiformis]|uniref:Uncharacterized protein n=1 Tax=Arthrobotrys musiformis TaxID=47236 RepID=A0AAV9WAE6_9PEZI
MTMSLPRILTSCVRPLAGVYKSLPVRCFHATGVAYKRTPVPPEEPTPTPAGKRADQDLDATLREIIVQSTLGDRDTHSHKSMKEEEPGEPTNLLITLDALGTLYKIRGDLGKQYTQVARGCGVEGLDERAVAGSFKKAFKELVASHPNYGFGTGMTPRQWWEQVTIKTFTPLLPASTPFPPSLSKALWTHFSSSSGYELHPSTLPFLRSISDLKSICTNTRRGVQNWKFRTITVGVISNSDHRVSTVLNSMNIDTTNFVTTASGHLGKIHAVSPAQRLQLNEEQAGVDGGSGRDIPQLSEAKREVIGDEQLVDFVATNCHLGFAKPSIRIFEAARRAAVRSVAERHGKEEAEREWEWYHVGDDPIEDVSGAYESGAVGVLFDPEGKVGDIETVVKGLGEGMGWKTMVVRDLREVTEAVETLGFMYPPGQQRVPYIPSKSNKA